MSNLVSVIMPVYQVSDYVERCLMSVMNQTYSHLECIIVNDVTKDDSIEKCERLINDYDGAIRFQIIHHEHNRGLSAARNTGTKAATGDFVYYVDSDDEMMPDCIEKLLRAALEYPEAEMVIGNAQFFLNGQKERVSLDEGMPSVIQSNELALSLYYQQRITNAAWNKLIRRSFIEEHDLYFKEGIIVEDYLWEFFVMKYLSTVPLVKDITYHYYKRSGSIMTSADDQTFGRSYFIIYEEILQHLTAGRENKELTQNVASFCKFYLKHKATIPAYKDLHGLYRRRTRQYGCWYAYLVLVVVGAIGCFGNPAGFLGWLNSLRWKVKHRLEKKWN